MEDHFYKAEGASSARESPSLHAMRLENGQQRAFSVKIEVDDVQLLQGLAIGYPTPTTGGEKFRTTFLPHLQDRGELQHPQQQHRPLPGYSERGAGAERGFYATLIAQDIAGDFTDLHSSRTEWDQPSGEVSHSTNTGNTLCRTVPRRSVLDDGNSRLRDSASRGGQQQRWEAQPHNGSAGSGEHSMSGYFTALTKENSSERRQSIRPRISLAQQQQPQRNPPRPTHEDFRKVSEQPIERISRPAPSTFLAEMPRHWETAERVAPAPGRMTRGREHVTGGGFLAGGVTYTTSEQQHSRRQSPFTRSEERDSAAVPRNDARSSGWDSRPELRAMTSPAAAHPRHGPANGRALYPLGPSLSSSSPPLTFSRQHPSPLCTPQLQCTPHSHPGRILHNTFGGSRSGEGYDNNIREQQQRVAPAAGLSVPNMTGLVLPAQHVGENRADGRMLLNEKLIFTASRSHHRDDEAMLVGAGRWQGNDHSLSDSSGISTVSTGSSRGGYPVEGFNHMGQQQQPRRRRPQRDTASTGAFNFTRRVHPPNHEQQQAHHYHLPHPHSHRINRRPGVSSPPPGDDARGGVSNAFNHGASSSNTASSMESLPTPSGQKHQQLDGGVVGESGSGPSFGGAETFQPSSSEYVGIQNGGDGGEPAAGSAAVMTSRSPPCEPSSSTLLQAPNSPLEWLQNFNRRQSVKEGSSDGNDEGSATARTSRSSSASSLSPSLRGGGGGGGGSGGGSGGAASTEGCSQSSPSFVALQGGLAGASAAVRGTCPATDCPGNGDCLPGATPDMLVYEVRFKRATRTFLPEESLDPKTISCGTLVNVEADRGEDLGTVHRSLPLSEYLLALQEEKKAKAAKIAENGGGGGVEGSESKKKRGKAKKNEAGLERNGLKQQQQKKKEEESRMEACPVKAIKRILRPATSKEHQQLLEKSQEEASVLRVCQSKVRHRNLPMKIVDAEYQSDMHKLTLFFEAERRIDFRELVRDLFAVYKTRIWMQQVKDKDAAPRSGASTPAASDNDTAAPTAPPGCCNDSGGGPPSPEIVPQQSHVGDPYSVGREPVLDADHDSGYGSGSSTSGGSGQSESDTSLVDVSSSPLWPGDQVAAGGDVGRHGFGGTAVEAEGNQPQQQQHQQQQQQPALPSSYPNLLSDLGEIAIEMDTDERRHPQYRQHQQQEPASKSSYSDLLLGFDVGELALSMDMKQSQQRVPQHNEHLPQSDQHAGASAHPSFLNGFDFMSF